MKTDCENKAIRDFSRWQQVSGRAEKQPPVEIMNVICPGGCSRHGSCVNGKTLRLKTLKTLYIYDGFLWPIMTKGIKKGA